VKSINFVGPVEGTIPEDMSRLAGSSLVKKS
jgi:hypothetical protein